MVCFKMGQVVNFMYILPQLKKKATGEQGCWIQNLPIK